MSLLYLFIRLDGCDLFLDFSSWAESIPRVILRPGEGILGAAFERSFKSVLIVVNPSFDFFFSNGLTEMLELLKFLRFKTMFSYSAL